MPHYSTSSGSRLSRRDFLRQAGAGLAVLAAGSLAGSLTGCTIARADHVSGSAVPNDETTPPDLVLALRAAPGQAAILPGRETSVWRYSGEVVRGRADALAVLPGSYLGPTLRLNHGERVRIHLTNELPEPTIVHWHGLHLPEEADGHPRLAIAPGETYTYDFQVINRAGTYWYHPHPHGTTGPQVYAGLAGLLIVSDAEEQAAGLPSGEQDVSLVLQDRLFTADNQFSYPVQGMHGQMVGVIGDRILVNGRPDFALPVATRPYRLRILNGSNARIYRLGWQDGRPLQVIGTDGGLLERALTRHQVVLSPGERIELWVDLGPEPVGSELVLENQDYPSGESFPVARLQIARSETAPAALPDPLSVSQPHSEADAVNRGRPRAFPMELVRGRWLLNGREFEMAKVARNEVVRLGDLEIWEFVNESPHMAMPHPMHVHNVQFQVIGRELVLPQFEGQYQAVAGSLVDEGWKDTVLVMPGERVRILLKFEHYEGLYLYHCHNLEHEDMGMMRNYRIKA